jgi:quercetin dioxygenase-like cupin family protein
MNATVQTSPQSITPVPADDGQRDVYIAQPDDPSLRHLAVVGDTYTILIAGKDTAGRYALIDMEIPIDGGPPPHRHDFEEMFHILEGSVEVTFRGETSSAGIGDTVNIPANAPHSFHNTSGAPMRLLCMVSPAGLEEYFAEFGDEVASRTAPAPDLDADEKAERMEKAKSLASKYRIEVL